MIYIKIPPKAFFGRCLSFDGGGVRAIAAVVFLKRLEIASGKKIFDIFVSFQKRCVAKLREFFSGTFKRNINLLKIP